MNRNQVRVALLKISLCTLAGMTWIFCSFIFSTRPEDHDLNTLTALVRLPASIPAQLPTSLEGLPSVFATPTKANAPIEMGVMNVACWDKSDDSGQETTAKWIRLTGRPCTAEGLESAKADTVSVTNLTTGYSATVFPTQTQAKNLTTDYFPLQDGKNEIVIRLEQGPGVAVEQRFSFYRN